jgi:Domain of unknown function (DUF397)
LLAVLPACDRSWIEYVHVRTFLNHAANTSHSNAGANCMEVARTRSGKIAVRDSRNPDGGALSFSPPDKWQALVAKVQARGSDS